MPFIYTVNSISAMENVTFRRNVGFVEAFGNSKRRGCRRDETTADGQRVEPRGPLSWSRTVVVRARSKEGDSLPSTMDRL